MPKLQDKLHAMKMVLKYDPETGILCWSDHPEVPELKRNQPVTMYHTDTYLSFAFLGRQWPAHRVAWLLHHGQWPQRNLRHLNGDNRDNRIANLAVASEANRHVKRGERQNAAAAAREAIDGALDSHPYPPAGDSPRW